LRASVREKLLELNAKEQLNLLKKEQASHTWELALPGSEDFNPHTTEIKVDALELGMYAILASADVDFEAENTTGFSTIAVSNIGYWTRQNADDKTEFVVFHRDTGAPMAGVQTEFFVRNYERVVRKNQIQIAGKAQSDENGFVLANPSSSRGFQVKFSKGKDVLYLGEGYSNYRYNRSKNKTQSTHFFLDRAIYRPGQTVYFKAIVLEQGEEDIPRILPRQPIKVTFLDANYQEVQTLELRTNEYGTVNGEFTAPSQGLLGNMYLKSDVGNSQQVLKVEEYKRPKFAVTFLPIQKSYRLEDTVSLTGQANAFAGNTLDGARVNYRIVRQVRYPWRPWWVSRYYAQDKRMEVKNGMTTTNADGQFTIDFPALPDREANPEHQPSFEYTVYVDVIDITGETRSNKTTVRVGHVALEVELDLPKRIALNTFDEIKIETKNLNGVFEEAQGTITVHRLKTPQQVYTKRYWEKPDQYTLSAMEFKAAFPHLPYQSENEIQNWDKGEQVVQQKFNTANAQKIALRSVAWEAGSYVLSLKTQDRYGKVVELERPFTLYDLERSAAPFAEVGWHLLDKEIYQPKDLA
ncbi:MAG: MG2 domain-containing protein, partial [Bacteroidota bacterium]